MPADRDQSSSADIVFTAISPALIMLMVGSLVFFLITVLPTGEYKERLLYTTFFFVFGAVLVARIAIQLDGTKATVYGIGLAVVTFLAMSAYVEYPAGTWLRSFGWLVNIGLMGLIWWSAHKLTWDCTHVDANRDASGRGLLAASGLEVRESGDGNPETAKPEAVSPEPPATVGKKKRRKKNAPKPPSAFGSWTTRWWNHHEKQKGQPHTPGVWVIYFSLAALPLFAIGQSLLQADDAERRRATFLQMAVYVGSGLGLLVTTSLLGLRRYLKQRKAKMTGSLTAGWLGLGAGLIVLFLVIGAFLPRPYSEVPWFGLPRDAKSKREASQFAQLKDSAGKGDGANGDVTEKGKGTAAGKNGEPGGSKGDKVSRDPKGSGKSKDGDPKGGADSKEDSRDPKGSAEAPKDKDDRGGPNTKTEPTDKDAQGKDESSKSSSRPPETKLGAVVQKIAGFLKWLVIAIVVFLVLVAIVLAVLRYLAPFTAWARNLLDALKNWWANLFGGKAKAQPAASAEPDQRGQLRPPPFTDYSNPFADGSAARREPEELVAYTFAALDAWAWDRGHGRQPAETPLEFAARLGVEFPDFETSLRRLANLYARVAYADGKLPEGAVAFLEQFWEQMVHGVEVVATVRRR